MFNFNNQLQQIKFQIDNLKLQITNIEIQNNNMNASFQGEQLMNLGIQMFNTGLNSFNFGKSLSTSSFDNYYIQLKNISEQIINIINEYEGSIQQMQMMMMQQNQLMQAQMMNQNNFNNQENFAIKKMNLTFEIKDGYWPNINIVCNHGTKIKDALEMFSTRVGKNKEQFIFICNGSKLDYNDNRKIEQLFSDDTKIWVIPKK